MSDLSSRPHFDRCNVCGKLFAPAFSNCIHTAAEHAAADVRDIMQERSIQASWAEFTRSFQKALSQQREKA